MKANKILAIGFMAAATVFTVGCSDDFLKVNHWKIIIKQMPTFRKL